jgi:hypothetical protein
VSPGSHAWVQSPQPLAGGGPKPPSGTVGLNISGIGPASGTTGEPAASGPPGLWLDGAAVKGSTPTRRSSTAHADTRPNAPSAIQLSVPIP